MATHFLKKVLLLLTALFFLGISASGNAQENNLCVDCHKSHYTDIAGCVTCHRGIPETRRKDLAHQNLIKGKYAKFLISGYQQRQNGVDLIKASGCRRCHRIGRKGNTLSVDLVSSVENLEVKEIVKAIKKPSEFMPDFNFTSEQITSIINGLFYLSFTNEKTDTNFTQVVHINTVKSNIFSKECGGCHKMISPERGSVGGGFVAPNLSGLFTKYYPGEIDGKRWNAKVLKKWLNNPRSLKNNALMPVLELTEQEYTEIKKTFGK